MLVIPDEIKEQTARRSVGINLVVIKDKVYQMLSIAYFKISITKSIKRQSIVKGRLFKTVGRSLLFATSW
ncbi:hypothetical protein SAE01_04810 [Segetibacter aerophilus]|uniref:Uncharacterized protein n=1 Tax=Segetibacter aerophilus TaxID=670293 RepID=A0A512B7Q3_9BACT|nr:hypothetical protein SAE01_04810 [Segetibacter aerophilus]